MTKAFELLRNYFYRKGVCYGAYAPWEEKVPIASWLNFTRYDTFAHIFERKPESKRYEWRIAQIKGILKSEVYIGNSVHNRQSTVSFKSKKNVRKPESEWFRVKDTHEPIIEKEVFYRVQEQIKSSRRQTKEKAMQREYRKRRKRQMSWKKPRTDKMRLTVYLLKYMKIEPVRR